MGTHKQSNVAVAACFISDRRRWQEFDKEWDKAAKDPEDGFGAFHMADFNAGYKQFSGWSIEKKERVIGKILKIIATWTLSGFITAVVKDDYDRIITGRLREKLGEYHYTFAVLSCLAYIEQWFKVDILQPLEPAQYVFDRMSEGKHEIDDLFTDLIRFNQGKDFGIEVGGWSYQNKAVFLPLQSSDIIAWEGYRYMLDCQLPANPQLPRPSFESLVKSPGIKARFFGSSSLPGFAKEVSAKYEQIGWDNSPKGGFFPS